MSYTRTNLLRFMLLVTLGSLLIACGDTGTAAPRLRNLVYCENPDVAAPSCALPGYTVADDPGLHAKLQTCAAGGCHGDPSTAVTTWTLDLSGSVQNALTPLTSTIGLSGDYLVDEFDPDCSYMLTKLTNQPAGGSRMPLTPPHWSADEADCFRSYLHDMSN
jgi:hypothetical protein